MMSPKHRCCTQNPGGSRKFRAHFWDFFSRRKPLNVSKCITCSTLPSLLVNIGRSCLPSHGVAALWITHSECVRASLPIPGEACCAGLAHSTGLGVRLSFPGLVPGPVLCLPLHLGQCPYFPPCFLISKAARSQRPPGVALVRINYDYI